MSLVWLRLILQPRFAIQRIATSMTGGSLSSRYMVLGVGRYGSALSVFRYGWISTGDASCESLKFHHEADKTKFSTSVARIIWRFVNHAVWGILRCGPRYPGVQRIRMSTTLQMSRCASALRCEVQDTRFRVSLSNT